MQTALEPPARMKFMGELSRRMTRLMTLSILVVVVTGILQANQIYGLAYLLGVNVLSIKVVVALLMIGNGFYLGNTLPRQLMALAPPPARRRRRSSCAWHADR
jgi:uncharacterized membrane protein